MTSFQLCWYNSFLSHTVEWNSLNSSKVEVALIKKKVCMQERKRSTGNEGLTFNSKKKEGSYHWKCLCFSYTLYHNFFMSFLGCLRQFPYFPVILGFNWWTKKPAYQHQFIVPASHAPTHIVSFKKKNLWFCSFLSLRCDNYSFFFKSLLRKISLLV